MKKAPREPTPLEIVVGALNRERDVMRHDCANIGEPCVEIPLEDIQTYRGENGEIKAIIGMNKLIYLVDRVLRHS